MKESLSQEEEGVQCIEICRESYILSIKKVHLTNTAGFDTPPYHVLHSFDHLVLMVFYLKKYFEVSKLKQFCRANLSFPVDSKARTFSFFAISLL